MFKKTTFFAFPFVIGALALMSRPAAAEECESADACATKRSAPCILTCTLRGKVVKETTKEIEQFPKTLSGPVATTLAALPSTETEATSCNTAKLKCELEESNDNSSANGKGQITLVAAEAKCDGSCSGGSGSTCKSAEKATYKRGAQCQCGNNQQTVINAAAYREQLARLVRQSAELKAHTQAQRELAKHQAEFANQLLDARTEIAHLHARLEFAERKEELMEQLALAKMENVKLQASLKMQQREQEFFSHVQEQCESTSKVEVALREVMSENAALEDRIAMLEQALVNLRTRLARVPGDGAAQ